MTAGSSHEAEYEPLRLTVEEIDDGEKEELEFAHPPNNYESRRFRILFYVATGLATFFGCLSALLILRLLTLQAAIGLIGKGFPTEFKDALRTIEYEQKVFTGDIALDRQTREVYHAVPEGEPRYFGDPEKYPGIDKNWKELLKSACLFAEQSINFANLHGR
jgi:hypothetical protein